MIRNMNNNMNFDSNTGQLINQNDVGQQVENNVTSKDKFVLNIFQIIIPEFEFVLDCLIKFNTFQYEMPYGYAVFLYPTPMTEQYFDDKYKNDVLLYDCTNIQKISYKQFFDFLDWAKKIYFEIENIDYEKQKQINIKFKLLKDRCLTNDNSIKKDIIK